MTDAERAELADYQREWGKLRTRVEFSIKQREQRLAAEMRGESLPFNPMELSDTEWGDVRLGIEAWEAVVQQRRRDNAARS